MNILEEQIGETLSWLEPQDQYWGNLKSRDYLQWPQVAKVANFWWDDSNKAQVAQIPVESTDGIIKRYNFGIRM